MDLKTFFDNFETMAEAPNGVQKLREMILQLAVQGKLVKRVQSEGDGHQILKILKKTPFKQIGKKKRLSHATAEPLVAWDAPEHWAFTTLENTTRGEGLFADGDWVETKDQDPDGDVRLIQLADVGEGFYRDRSDRYMNTETATRLNCTFLNPGDILLARMPDPLGRACIFPGDPKPSVTVVDVCIVRPDSNFFDNSFIAIVINSPPFRSLIQEKATGTTRSRISRGNLAKFPIPIPPLAEQKRIVAKVDELMALSDDLEARKQKTRQTCIQINDACIDKMLSAREPARFNKHWQRIHTNFDLLYSQPENVNKLRQAILQLAVQGKLVPQDPNDEPASMLLEKIQNEKQQLIREKKIRNNKHQPPINWYEIPFEIPLTWEWVRLNDFGAWGAGATPNRSNQEYYGGTTPWLKSGELNDGHISISEEFITEKALKECSLRLNQPGDVLIAMYGATIGKVAIAQIECTTNQAVCACTCFSGVDNRFLLFLLKAYKDYFIGKGEGGAQPNISRIKIISTIAPLPPEAEQKRIVAKVDQFMALCDDLETKLQKSQKSNGRLMEAAVAEMLAA